jgi:hypothetical protein
MQGGKTNPKFEARNQKQARTTKIQKEQTTDKLLAAMVWNI